MKIRCLIKAALIFVLNGLLLQSSLAATATLLVNTDAHEGPVYVASLNRLYFTTQRGTLGGEPNVAIKYLDLKTLEITTFVENSNMANGMFLANDGRHLLVAEQGNLKNPGGISSIDVVSGEREVLTSSYHGKEFNSPNKVIQGGRDDGGRDGLIYFSDPDYGYNQGFKSKPVLPNAVYVLDPKTRNVVMLTSWFKMPHGLALTKRDQVLLVGDTSAINGKDPYQPDGTHDIYAVTLQGKDHAAGIEHLLTVTPGIPDGFVMVGDDLYIAKGDGVECYTETGVLIDKYLIPGGAVNLTLAKDELLVTADSAIYKLMPIQH